MFGRKTKGSMKSADFEKQPYMVKILCCVCVFRLQVLLAVIFIIIYCSGLEFFRPFSSLRNIPSSNDVTLENAIKSHWKP